MTPPWGILFVDDEEIIHKGMSPFLRQLGYTVDDAYDGPSALDLMGKKSYDLAFVDMQMPKMDGMTLLENITKAYPDVAVVIISGHNYPEMALKSIRMGAADCLTKPVKLTDIEVVIEKAMRLRDLRRKAK